MYIKAYSEYMAYSGIFRTGDIFSQLQAHYSGITQEQFVHIPNLGRFRYIWNSDSYRHVMFHAYAGIFSTLEYVIKQCFMQNKNILDVEPQMSCLCNFGL